MDFDFKGYATRNDIKCSDGRTIRRDAFKECDGQIVPLVWNHQQDSPNNVLGHALLENRADGVYAYGKFNDSEAGQSAKILVENGDVSALSIYANQLKHNGGNVLHGKIREVSIVLAGANPGAYIDSVVKHGDGADTEEEAVIYSGDEISLSHSDDEKKEEKPVADDTKKNDSPEKGKTVADVFDTLNEEQKTVVYALIGQALEDNGKETDSEKEEKEMKHNVFDKDERQDSTVICHSDQQAILADAKKHGSFRQALDAYTDDHLTHGDNDSETAEVSGFDEESLNVLFPEYKDVRPGMPELISYDQGWVTKVINGVHKSPFSRIRTRQVDIRNIDSLKAKGYDKGKKKALTGKYSEVRRTTDPQTVYVKSALNRDDIVDITDFDYVAYQYRIDRQQLNETLAMAIMVGDFREDEDPDKINPNHIRPIWYEDELYCIHGDVDLDATTSTLQGTATGTYFGENYVYAEAIIEKSLYLREQYKGSGSLTFFCAPHLVNIMLLARDRNGRRIYNNKADLAAALNVSSIETVEQFDGLTRVVPATSVGDTAKTKKLLGIYVNLADYSVGSTKGGEITHFNQFDIDFNLEKSLLETRVSGALTRIKSAIVLEEDVTSTAALEVDPEDDSEP